MRPTRPVLATLAGTLGLIAASAAPAFAADAEVAPRRVAPGGTLTLSVSCDPHGGSIPGSIQASSQALDKGTVRLGRVTGRQSDAADGPAYTGTARVAGPGKFPGGGPEPVGRISKWGVDGTCPGGEQWAASFEVDRGEPDGPPRAAPPEQPGEEPERKPQSAPEPEREPERKPEPAPEREPEPERKPESAEHPAEPAPEHRPDTEPGHQEEHGPAHRPEPHQPEPHQAPHEGARGPASGPQGPVRTGVGGAFGGTDTAALAGGSALLLATVCGAVYWRRRTARGRP
ncbi:hypothetical protein V1J52_02035 [Streptomyces sp. TRM 70351]|uniref:hypothetical protein n=1 Tax=Streptomyces sp. TRM 70351 TaxID=3116552 RepID=UPI002E7B55A6|nr:hypothetical protein [Streptomyces sp. TRM 70351]MEE1926969.1 hypothetical protein [Streptomyces sp. TRM 70351]